jgi:hypothetical protein
MVKLTDEIYLRGFTQSLFYIFINFIQIATNFGSLKEFLKYLNE